MRCNLKQGRVVIDAAAVEVLNDLGGQGERLCSGNLLLQEACS